jgi:hypothetical protein
MKVETRWGLPVKLRTAGPEGYRLAKHVNSASPENREKPPVPRFRAKKQKMKIDPTMLMKTKGR